MTSIEKLLLCGVSAGALVASAANAQTASSAAPVGRAGASGDVEEVVVTARRREEALQDVPVAVTAVSAAQLEARTVKTILDISRIAPGLNIGEGTRGAAVPIISMRGQENTGTAITNGPAVGIYFDEVYLGRSAGALIASVDDMASVQVLRGPQGTLFGRNNTGGAILLTPNRPNLEDFSGQLTVSGGSYNRFEYGGVVDVPIVDGAFGIRASYKRTRRDGIGESIVTGIHSFGDLNRENGRISARWKPSEAVTFDFTYDWVDIDERGPMTQSIVPFPGLGFYQNRHGLVHPSSTARVDGYTFRSEFEVNDDLTFKAIVGRRIQSTDLKGDVDAGPAISVDAWQFMNQSQWTAELQATGTTLRSDTSFMKELNYTAGFFYFSESGEDGSSLPLPAALDPLRSARYLNNFADNSSAAGYLQVESNHGDRLFITLGGRYTKDKRDLTITALGSGRCTLLALPVGTPPSVCFQSGSKDFGYWSYSAGARYELTSDANLYVKYDKGQRAGGLDDTPTSIEPFNPEVVKSFEIGAKADFLDRRLRTNIAVYTSKVGQVQRTTLLAAPDGSPYTSVFNAAKSRVRGVELEAVLRPVTGLTFEGSVSRTDAKYLEFADARPGPGRGQDLSYLRYPNTPKTTYNLSASYDTQLAELGRLLLRVDYAHRSWTEFDVFNDPRTRQKPYGLVNARVQLDLSSLPYAKGVSIAGYARNLTNVKYSTWGTTAAGGILVRTTDPRSYGAELKLSF